MSKSGPISPDAKQRMPYSTSEATLKGRTELRAKSASATSLFFRKRKSSREIAHPKFRKVNPITQI